MAATLAGALRMIETFVLTGDHNVIWEDLCVSARPYKPPLNGSCLLDELGIECSETQRRDIRSGVRNIFLDKFRQITVPTKTASDRKKAQTWYDNQKNEYWTLDKKLAIIAIVIQVAADVLSKSAPEE